MSEHTELPWKIIWLENTGTFSIFHAPTGEICSIHPGVNASSTRNHEEHEANAEYIVRACNNYKKLLDTLRVIRSQAQNITTNPRLLLQLIQESAHETIIEICQPLAKAKENEP